MLKGLTFLAASEIRGVVRRKVNGYLLYAIGAVVALIGTFYVLSAIQFALLTRMSPIAASLAIAAALLAIAGILFLAGRAAEQRKVTNSSMTAKALVAAPLATRVVGGKINLGTLAVAGVVAIGALLGRQMGKS
jgi:hypothetical protein